MRPVRHLARHARRRQDLGVVDRAGRQPQDAALQRRARRRRRRCYLASEQGTVFKLDRAARALRCRCATGYKGSFFGVVGTRDFVRRLRPARHGLPLARRRRAAGSGSPPACRGGLTAAQRCSTTARLLFVSQDGRVMRQPRPRRQLPRRVPAARRACSPTSRRPARGARADHRPGRRRKARAALTRERPLP